MQNATLNCFKMGSSWHHPLFPGLPPSIMISLQPQLLLITHAVFLFSSQDWWFLFTPLSRQLFIRTLACLRKYDVCWKCRVWIRGFATAFSNKPQKLGYKFIFLLDTKEENSLFYLWRKPQQQLLQRFALKLVLNSTLTKLEYCFKSEKCLF